MAEFSWWEEGMGGRGALWVEGWGMAARPGRQDRDDVSPELQMVKIKREKQE